jgi:RNA-directed DNA polymerase
MNIYVRSQATGERVMAALRRLSADLRLRVNEAKSTVAPATQRQVLAFSFWVANGGAVKRRVAPKALARLNTRVRELTRRNGGKSLGDVAQDLGRYPRGWRAYFSFTEMPTALAELDRWIRHRLRAIQLKQWKRGTTVFRELTARGVKRGPAAKVAMHTCRWWRTSGTMDFSLALPNGVFDKLGVPPACPVASTNRTARRGPTCRAVWQGR